ncbi:hypothetical protein ACIA5C_47185 [Actinoplanes sp. NPDC051343]|uniref:hypothetical protein n=1 Tax=Actinoplanes sp. NPDC051343 TaxID=3363906 RepID=UPI0037A2D0EB
MLLVALVAFLLGRHDSQSAVATAPSSPTASIATWPSTPAASEGTETSAPTSVPTGEPSSLSTSVSGPSAPGVAASVGQVLRTGRLTLSENYCADLDTQAANWSVTESDCGTVGAIDGDGDIRNLDFEHGFYGPNNTDFAILDESTPGTFASCQGATSLSPILSDRKVVKGLRFCVRTTDHNLSLLDVVAVEHQDDQHDLLSVTFQVTTWKGE